MDLFFPDWFLGRELRLRPIKRSFRLLFARLTTAGQIVAQVRTARFDIIQVDAKREIEKVVHRSQAVELKAVLGLLLDLYLKFFV